MGYDGGRNIAGFGLVPPVDDPNGILNLRPANDDFLQLKSGLWVNRTVAQVRADLNSQETIATDAAFTLVVGTNAELILCTGTLTADRAVTLSTSGAARGAKFKITRTGGGAYLLNVGIGPLKALSQNMWAEFIFDGTAWYLSAHGFTDGTAFGQSLVNDADAAAGKTTLGVISPAMVFIAASGAVSGVATIDFTSGFSSAYDEYVFMLRAVGPVTDNAILRINVSSSAGSIWSNNVSVRGAVVLGSTATASAGTTPSISGAIDNQLIDRGATGEVRLIKTVESSNQRTAVTWQLFADANDSGVNAGMVGAMNFNTGEVNGVRFLFSTGNANANNILMYGVKNS